MLMSARWQILYKIYDINLSQFCGFGHIIREIYGRVKHHPKIPDITGRYK